MFEFRRDRSSESLRYGNGDRFHVLLTEFDEPRRFEHRPARQQEVTDGTDGVQVAASIHRIGGLNRFGCHVKRRAGQRVARHGVRLLLFVDRFDQAEIKHLDDIRHATATIEHDIRRFDISMNQPQ